MFFEKTFSSAKKSKQNGFKKHQETNDHSERCRSESVADMHLFPLFSMDFWGEHPLNGTKTTCSNKKQTQANLNLELFLSRKYGILKDGVRQIFGSYKNGGKFATFPPLTYRTLPPEIASLNKGLLTIGFP